MISKFVSDLFIYVFLFLKEEKADVISKYIHVFQTVDCAFLYIDTFFQTMAREWMAIDRYRLEKFMMVSSISLTFINLFHIFKTLNYLIILSIVR